MTWFSDLLTLTFGLAALVFAVTVLIPGAQFSGWLRAQRWVVAKVVGAAGVISMIVVFVGR